MELSDEIEISVPMQTVYDGLNNVDILKKCIPGCEELVRKSDNQLEAKVVLKVGPVKARFSGQVTLDASGGPEKFSLSGQGNGGAAGFAKGAKVTVVPLVLPKVEQMLHCQKKVTSLYCRIKLKQKLVVNWLN